MAVTCAVIALQVQTLVYWQVSTTRRAVCEDRDGTYFPARSNAQCIQDGRIVILWTLSGRVDNP